VDAQGCNTPPEEEPLAGNVSTVIKIGDTVRRNTGPWTPAVHALLRHLEEVGFEGAPRVLGVDEQGREILTYISEEEPRRGDPTLETDQALIEVGSLLRQYHEAVADFALPSGMDWQQRSSVSGPVTLVCHNDISPTNTVFRDGHPIAFLDWDLASPAPPAWDIAHAAWQFVPLTDDAGCSRLGWSSPPDRAHRLRIICDAYGLSEEDRSGFTELVIQRMEVTASGIEALATAGNAAHKRLVAENIPELVRTDSRWVARHARELVSAALRVPRSSF
jgi:hypothetical protein